MGTLGRLYRGENDFDFRRAWRVGVVVSVVGVVASLAALLTSGLNLGIDFEGGVAWEVPAPGVSVDDARGALDAIGEGNAKIQVVGGDHLRVQAGPQGDEEIEAVTAALVELSGSARGDVSVSTVGPSWGDEITDAAVRALVWFFIVIAAYITVRLEWRMAVGALVAVVHDILLCVGVYAILGFEVTPGTVIAFLTILGYSLYDTIVVYDKVHEMVARSGGRETYDVLMSRALNQVMMRSVNTTLTSLLPVVSMLVIGAGVLGAVTLQDFSIALAVGLLSGAYSSIFVAAPVVVLLRRNDPDEVARRQRAERLERSGREPVGAADAEATVAVTPSGGGERPELFSTGHPPRPRKKGKRR